MRIAIIILTLCVVFTSYADDLDIIVDRKSTPDERGMAYNRLTSADFNLIAKKLATLIGTNPVLTGIGPRTKQPWNENQLREGDRIGCTLGQLWKHHVRSTNSSGQKINIMLNLLEDSSVGNGRHLVISELSVLLHSNRQLSTAPLYSQETIIRHLDRLARDSKQPNYFRERIVKILFAQGDPNLYLDMAIELSSTENTPLGQAEAFRSCTECFQKDKFTETNRKKYVRHCFELLAKIDDGKSGSGYFLAMQVGDFLGIPPIRASECAFAPDMQSKEYQDTNGNLTQDFFHDTVTNAREWWNKHNREF